MNMPSGERSWALSFSSVAGASSAPVGAIPSTAGADEAGWTGAETVGETAGVSDATAADEGAGAEGVSELEAGAAGASGVATVGETGAAASEAACDKAGAAAAGVADAAG
jgi:hypothetical protein